MAKQVIMPKFGMDQEEGTVVAWFKEEGATVEKGEPILEVETDKINMEVEAPASGILRGIQIGPGVTVPIGKVIAYILDPGEELPDAQPDASQQRSDQPPPPDPGSPIPDHEVGAQHHPRSPIPKATPVAEQMANTYGMDLAAIPASGKRITRSDVENYIAGRLAATQPSVQPSPAGPVLAVPAARRRARELGVDLASVRGTGPHGRIQSRDVEEAARQARSTPIEPTAVPAAVGDRAIRRTVPLTGMRRTIARRLTESAGTIPQFTVSVDVRMERAEEIVADARSAGEEDEPRVTLTALLVKACAWTLARHPAVNATFNEDEIVEWADVNVGVAVAVEDGLLVPVIRNADRLSLSEIAIQLADLAGRARSNQLTPRDLEGGTFTISNLGMFGVDNFTAIVNPPQAAILAVGRTQKQPVVTETDRIEVCSLANFTLSADHRALDGALAARFLADLKKALERPGLLMG